MTSWPTDETADELDPTAALSGDPVESSEPDYGNGEDVEEGDGFTDETKSVTVWVDDDHRLVKVYLSNRWRERSKEPLTQRFMQALVPSQMRAAEPRPLPTSALPGREPGAEIPLDTVHARLQELREKRRELKNRPPGEVRRSTWTGTVGRGTSDDHNVSVVLTREEATAELTIDETWARTARAEQIADAVLQAHRAAYAAHVPGEHRLGEFGVLAAEAAALANELMPTNRR